MTNRTRQGSRGGRHVAGWIAGGVSVLIAGAVASYPLWRARCLTWGATAEEAARTLPGDDQMPDPDLVATRAITIHTPASAVWPWLVQMGPGRGGAYTYDWVENLLGLNMHSANEIRPEWQNLRVGDVLPLRANGPGLRVAGLRPERALVLRSEDDRWVWSLVLDETAGTTRLISRNLIRGSGASFPRKSIGLLMEPASLIMERRMLVGIRDRAERGYPGPVDADGDAGKVTNGRPDDHGDPLPAAGPGGPPAPSRGSA